MIEENDPRYPGTGGIENGFDPSLERIVELDLALKRFRDVAPAEVDEPGDNGWNDVDDHREIPRYQDIRCSPEKPSGYIECHVLPMRVSVGFEIVEMEDDGYGCDEAGEDGRANKGGQEKGGNAARTVQR